MFKNNEQSREKDRIEKEFLKKYKNLKKPEGKELTKILHHFKNKEYFREFYSKNLTITRRLIRESVKDDLFIIQTINNVQEINRSINLLIKRLREWYALYNPEFENSIRDQEKFVELAIKKSKKDLLNEIKADEADSMGADFSKTDLDPVIDLAREVGQLFQLRKKQEDYLKRLMEKVCPNVLAVAGTTIGAKLIEQAGGLKQLMLFPASTIQLLGAEKALFRHMKTKAKSPKYGFLHEHPLISGNPGEKHGKIARALADKISIAVKIDYFKGKFIGDTLRKEVEDKFK